MFKIGDLVIVLNLPGFNYGDTVKPGWIGKVVGPLEWAPKDPETFGRWSKAHAIEFPWEVELHWISPIFLWKIDPPSNPLRVLSWDECVWSPTKVRETV